MSAFIHLNVGEELVIYKRLSEPAAEPITVVSGFHTLLLCSILFIGIFFGHKFGGTPTALQNQESKPPQNNSNTHYKAATTLYR